MLADTLLALKAHGVLVLAAERGLITALSCAMPECVCPEGRTAFERMRSPWAPSPDHHPIPARDAGPMTPDNVRLAHLRCNLREGGRVGGLRSVHAQRPEERVANSRRGGFARARNLSAEELSAIGTKASRAASGAGGRARAASLSPEQIREIGRLGGLANGSARRAPEVRHAVAIRAGRASVARRTAEEQRRWSQMGGRAANHARWHVGRGQANPSCGLCVDSVEA